MREGARGATRPNFDLKYFEKEFERAAKMATLHLTFGGPLNFHRKVRWTPKSQLQSGHFGRALDFFSGYLGPTMGRFAPRAPPRI